MNTKGIKFLAVFAVLAMAFAAFAVVAPADESDAAPVVFEDLPANGVITTAGNYFIDSDKTVKTESEVALAVSFYLTSTASIKVEGANLTTSVYAANATTKAAVTVEDAKKIADLTVSAGNSVTIKFTKATEAKINGTAATLTAVAKGTSGVDLKADIISVASATLVENLVYNAYFQNDGETLITYYGTPAATYTLDTATDKLVVFEGNTTIMGGTNTVKLLNYKDDEFSSTAGVTFTYPAENSLGANGVVKTGQILVTAMTMKVTTGGLTITAGDSIVTGMSSAAIAASAYAADTTIAYTPSATNYIVIGEYTHPDKNPKVAQKLTIDAGATLIIPAKSTFTYGNKDIAAVADETITINGTLDVWGTLKGVKGNAADVVPTMNGTGALKIRAGAEVTGFVNAAGVSTFPAVVKETPAINDVDLQGISGTLDENTTIKNAEVPTGKKLTVPEGVTLTVTGMLVINSDLGMTIEGTLVIADGAMLAVNDNTVGIILGEKGKIQNNGIIAKYNPVTITAPDTSSVTMNGVAGVVLGIAKKNLTVSGTLSAITGANTSAISFTKVNFNADTTISEGLVATLATEESTLSGKTMTINGVLVPTKALKLKAGSIVDVKGYVKAEGEGIVAETTVLAGVKKDADAGSTTTFITAQGVATKDASPNIDSNLTGYKIYVVKESFTDDDDVEMYKQFAYITGTLSVTPSLGAGYALTIPATLTITGGPAFIASGEELAQNIANAEIVATANLIVEGKLTSINDIDLNVIGAKYAITANDVTTNYVVDYNTGLKGIAGYKDKTVELVGLAGYKAELKEDLTILDKESVTQDVAVEFLTIPEGVVLTVNGGGSFENTPIEKLDGKIIVMKDGTCDPAGKYQVYAEDEFENITYCGFVTALSEAAKGDVITLTAAYTADSLTIPEGISVVVDSTGALTIKKTMTVSTDAKVEINGNFTLGTADGKTKNVKLTVNGAMDISSTALPAQFYTFTTNPDDTPATEADQKAYALQIISNGTFIYRTTQEFPAKAVMVGVTYVDGTTTVLTTIDKALEAEASEITIPGEYTTENSIALGSSTLNITGKANISAIDAKDGKIVVAGELTTTVSGISDESDAATVALNGFKGTIQDKSVADKYTFAIEAMTAGSVEIISGEVTFTGEAITVAAEKTFKVDSNATLVADAALTTLTLNGSMNIDGALSVPKDKSLVIEGDKLTITGDVVVDGALTFDKSTVSGNIFVFGDFEAKNAMKLTGTIDVDDSEESVASAKLATVVLGASTLSAAPTIDGKEITLAAGSFLKVFPGSVVGEKTVKNLKMTEFYVNDALYVTAYANEGEVNDVAGDGIISAAISVKGYNMDGSDDATKWKDSNKAPLDAATKVGAKDKVYFTGTQLTASVIISATTGTSVFVDGVKYASGVTVNGVAMGKHTVTVSIDPGYKGTATAAFNGKTVSGSFEITSDLVGDVAASVLSVTGEIQIDPGVTPTPTPSESGFGITEILMIVLVILVAVMIVVVILRLNRS